MFDWRQPTSDRLTGRRGVDARLRFLRKHPLCLECQIKGITRAATEVDHVMPLALGGYDIESNKQSLCAECHRAKTARDFGKRLKPRVGVDGWPVAPRPASNEAQERRFPSGLLASRIPVVMVCGPPASGKSTYVAAHAAQDDLVIDLDLIIEGISKLPVHQAGPEWVGRALDQRNIMLRSLATDLLHPRAWFVVGAADLTERKLWAGTLRASVILLDTPLDECIRRIKADQTRKPRAPQMISAAQAWWAAQR